MRQYGLSKSKLLAILRKPERKEQGIVPGTTAVMRTNPPSHKATAGRSKILEEKKVWSPKRAPGEIWLMYRDANPSTGSGQEKIKVRKIISAWRYPGISKPGEAIPIPEDILRELQHGNE